MLLPGEEYRKTDQKGVQAYNWLLQTGTNCCYNANHIPNRTHSDTTDHREFPEL